MNGDEKQRHPATEQTDGTWQYRPTDDEPTHFAPETHVAPSVPPAEDITWTASEFIARHKGVEWYLILFGATALLAVAIYFLSKDFITVGAIVVAIVLFGVAAGRKPRVLTYQLNDKGLKIGQKFYPYSMFKSFSVIDEEAFSSVMLLPLKRFMPPISVYYEPKDEERILTLLSTHLPVEHRQVDMMDHLMRRIRF